ncbi:hypothetical protein HMN09_00657900 [Mycena chlorophos]|uniref:Uncharacterized protein n=1 Tax=Mycena chlorophos TaxID=658473 RepID=A0A8H6T692_MYCCL|nr:hypothetical protein HMN09_00657900 [Mycena chlorophos]
MLCIGGRRTELEAMIISLYVDDPATLRACALACSRLCYWAQSRLFCTIITNFDVDGRLPWSRRAQRLADIFDRSPHLLFHVRSLVIGDSYPALLAVLATQKWKELASLELFLIPHESEDVVKSIQMLVSGASLETLRLAFGYETWSSMYFSRILANCSPTLVNIDLVHCSTEVHNINAPPQSPLAVSDTLNSPQRAQIQRLSLIESPGAVAALDTGTLPLDLTQVREVIYRQSPHVSLHSVLRQSRAHLTLKVDPNDLTLATFDFSLPSLRALECSFTARSVRSIISRIPRTSRLTMLTLTTSPNDWDPEITFLNHQHLVAKLFDDKLSERFDYLRMVRVEVQPSLRRSETELTPAELTMTIEQTLPKLSNAGMVSIIFL